MKEIQEYEKDLASIRTIMERSVKFISLSGLSGIMAGVYALIGATVTYFMVHYPLSPLGYRYENMHNPVSGWKLLLIAVLVLVASIGTGLWLTGRKAKRYNVSVWNVASRQLLTNMAIPLITGGLFILILLYNGYFELAAPVCLIFYGLALIHGSIVTYDEIRYLGFSELAIGLLCAFLPGYGLIFWSFGFGVLHIVYGAIMYNKYDK